MMVFMRVDRTGYILSCLFLTEYIKVFLKLTFHNPRPFMVFEDVEVFKCTTMYGLPSGHNMDSVCIPLCVLLDVYVSSNWTESKGIEAKGKSGCSRFMKIMLSFILYPCYWLLIFTDRLLLGVHSLDQVILGS